MDNTNSHSDSRGTIKDLLVTDDYSVTLVTFNEGAIRGNHYHEQTEQMDIVLKGKLICAKDGEQVEITKGDHSNVPANVRHAYKAVEPSELLSICWGVRKGEDYEKDVIRLPDNEKLL